MNRFQPNISTIKYPLDNLPNTVKESALALSYYYSYLWEKEMELSDVYALPYDTQSKHFVDFSLLAEIRES